MSTSGGKLGASAGGTVGCAGWLGCAGSVGGGGASGGDWSGRGTSCMVGGSFEKHNLAAPPKLLVPSLLPRR
jgi:hypothetical protein